MPRPAKGNRLGSSPAHESLMLANLASDLIEYGSIKTTYTRAKRLQPYVEKLITKGKKGDLASRRQVLKKINDSSVVHVLFTDLADRYKNRNGGYTRVVKTGFRQGDNAQVAIIELVSKGDFKSQELKNTVDSSAEPEADSKKEDIKPEKPKVDAKAEEEAKSKENESDESKPEKANSKATEKSDKASVKEDSKVEEKDSRKDSKK